MQLEIFKPSESSPVEWNHEALKAFVSDRMTSYKGIVYTEDQQAQAKSDRAALNKLLTALDGFKREEKKKALAGFEVTNQQIEEIKAIIIPCRDEIDAQEKRFTEFRKSEKRAKIEAEIYAPMIGNLAELIPYDKLHENKWLNVTCSMGTIGEEMARKIENITSGLAAIEKLDLDEALTEQARVIFLKDFNLSAAINATERILAQRAAYERARSSEAAQAGAEPPKNPAPEMSRGKPENSAEVKAEPVSEEETVYSVSFRIQATKNQLISLKAYMKSLGITPEKI